MFVLYPYTFGVYYSLLYPPGKFPKEKPEESFDDVDTPARHHKIHFPLSLCMEMRVMKKSEALLCPASLGNEEHIAYIEILSTAGTPGYEQFFADVGKKWIDLGGVPHWYKMWELLNQPNFDVYAFLRSKYGKNMKTFMRVHRQLNLDPDLIFMNKMMGKVFQKE